MKTPIINLGKYKNNNLYAKREDLISFSFGGNKYRIATELFNDMQVKGCDCIIGYGNARSNMCRVLSNIAFSKGIPCYIVSPADDDGSRIKTFNSQIVEDCKANFIFCTKDKVAETILKTIQLCKEKDLKPYYMYGNINGKGNESVLSKAYINVFNEIIEQQSELGTQFDYVFFAAGTGMTYSGLAIGKYNCSSNMKLVGISVARKREHCKNVLDEYFKAVGILSTPKDIIVFKDEYLCGGYGKYTKGISDIIDYSMQNFGMPLDPTYTGKAFFGMSQFLEENIVENKNILFIHTGGTPLFFDYYKEKNK